MFPCHSGVGFTVVKVASVYSKYCAFLNLVYIAVSLPFIGMFDIPLPFIDIPLPLIGMAAMPLVDPRVVLSKLLYPLGA
jgi:hypothetical protein